MFTIVRKQHRVNLNVQTFFEVAGGGGDGCVLIKDPPEILLIIWIIGWAF